METEYQSLARLATAQNVATNGRLFCVMLFAISLAAYVTGRGEWFGVLALLSALPVGLSVIAESLDSPVIWRVVIGLAVYAWSSAMFVSILISLLR